MRLKKIPVTIFLLLTAPLAFAQNVGINTITPQAPLDVHDTLNAGVLGHFTSKKDSAFVLLKLETTAPRAYVGTGYYQSGVIKAAEYLFPNGAYYLANTANYIYMDSVAHMGVSTNIPEQSLSVQHGMNIDQAGSNSGVANSLSFGSLSGAAIGSRRVSTGVNPHGLDFYTDSVNRMSITKTGNIGVGTTSPQQNLSVNNGMNIDQAGGNDGTTVNGLTFGGGSGEGIGSKRTVTGNYDGLDLYTNFTNRVAVTNGGLVGIGTTTPLSQLHVFDAANSGSPFLAESANSGRTCVDIGNNTATGTIGLRFFRNNNYQGSSFLDANNDYHLDLGAFTDLFVKASNGYIGIGTTSPQQNLSVVSGMNIDQANFNSGTISNTLRFGGNSGEGIGSKRTVGGNNYGLDFYTGSLNRMVINNSGLVGIGTTTPGYQLHVYDLQNTGYPLSVESNNAVNCVMAIATDAATSSIGTSFYRSGLFKAGIYVDPNNDFNTLLGGNTIIFGKAATGFVGIGTTAPQQNLSVNAGMNIDQAGANTGTVANGLSFGNASAEAIGSKRSAGGNGFGLDFYTNAVNRFSIGNTGKLGVGLISPQSKLEVRAGGVGVSSSAKLWEMNYDSTGGYFYFDEFGAARRLVIKNGGNVGIGNTNPSVPLDVTGNIKTSGDIIVQGNKGIVRSNLATPQKLITFNTGSISFTINPGGVLTYPVSFEAFSAPPVVYVANVSGTGEYNKALVTVTGVTVSGCTLNFYNPAAAVITFSGTTFNLVATGAQ